MAVAMRGGSLRSHGCQHTCRPFRAASKIDRVRTPNLPAPRHSARRPATSTALQLSGCITALATPFTAAGDIDLPAWQRLLQEQLDAGIHGVVVAGSTGEAAALFDAEFDTLLRSAVEQVGGRIPVLAGTGQSNTAKTIEANRRAAALGADGVLVVTPPYVRPTQSGLLAHFRAVADEGRLPVVLYNVPGRTVADMQPETALRLAQVPGIVGIKEASGNIERAAQLIKHAPDGFKIYSGDDGTAVALMLLGGHGNVSVTANVAPRLMHDMCMAAIAGDVATARRIHLRLLSLHKQLFCEPSPAPTKWALSRLGRGRPTVRLPITPLSPAGQALVDAALGDAGLL